jgi:eukaryotic-like serine/threonine-protein kinase
VLNTILRGHYKIISHLGGGGFGQTYLAEDIDLPTHPTCVVKQLKPLSNEPFVLETAKRLFDQEAEILYSLGSHDRIPRLLAHFQEGIEFYLVQEFADGLDLTQEIGIGKRSPEAEAIALLKEILEILVFVHGRGVVHRDIKPANLIRRNSDRKIVLIDFGAVKEIGGMAADLQGNTNLTIAIGSPGYMPIEQLNGKPRFSSDIYAVGMMGIQAITGAEPRLFAEHPDTAELVWRDRLEDSYSPQFLDILDKMVRYDFRQRYQTAQEVLEAIAAVTRISAANLSTVISDHDSVNIPETIITEPATSSPDVARNLARSSQKDCFPWKKFLLISGSIAAISTAVAINKLSQSNSSNEVINNFSQPTLIPKVTAPPVAPVVTVSASPTPPNTPEERLIREAKILNRFDKPIEALAKVEEALKLDPQNANAWEAKGLVLIKLQRENDAIASFEKAIELKPNMTTSRQYRDLLIPIRKPNLRKP